MIFESHDIKLLSLSDIREILPILVEKVSSMWESSIISITFYEDGKRFDEEFNSRDFSVANVPGYIEGVMFYRYKDMLDRWDWGVVTSDSFDGDGLWGIEQVTRESQIFDMELTGTSEVTFDDEGNCIPDFWLLAKLHVLELTIPMAPSEDAFFREVFSLVLKTVKESAAPN